MDDPNLPTTGTSPAPEEEGLVDELRALADDARTLAQAELAYQKSRATYAGKQALFIAASLGAALVFLFFAVEALVLGAVLALTPLLSAWGATAAVTAILVLAALLAVVTALARWRTMKTKITEQGDRS